MAMFDMGQGFLIAGVQFTYSLHATFDSQGRFSSRKIVYVCIGVGCICMEGLSTDLTEARGSFHRD